MTDYTPTTKQVRDGYHFDPEEDYYNPLQAGANAERAGRGFDRWLEQVKAEAWDEGHQTTQVLGPDDCQCHAWCECECACGLYGTGDILTSNPYRQEKES